MLHLKLVFALTNDQLLGFLVGQQKVGHGDGRRGSSRNSKKTTAGKRIFHHYKTGSGSVYLSLCWVQPLDFDRSETA
jgi:hypothetical protein